MALLMFPPPADTVVDVRSALTTQVVYPEGSPIVLRAKADISSGPVLGDVLSRVIQL